MRKYLNNHLLNELTKVQPERESFILNMYVQYFSKKKMVDFNCSDLVEVYV